MSRQKIAPIGLAAILLALTTACHGSPGTKTRADLRAALLARLKDPDSARFRNEAFFLNDDQAHPVRSLCGEVNARNGFGGYTGFTGFISTEEGNVFDEQDVPSGWAAVWATWCARRVK